MRNYIALIHKDADSDDSVSFPDLPGVISAGSTLEPSTLEAVMTDPRNRDGVAVLVPVVEGPPRIVRVNITLSEDVLRAIDSYAEQHGFTRSGFLATAAKRAMETAR